MGCGVSSTAGSAEDDSRQDLRDEALATDTSLAGIKRQETIRQAFVRLDEDIYTMESQCLGPRLATIEAWQQHLLKIKDTQQSANSLASTTTLNDSSDDYQFAPPYDKDVTSERERLAIVQLTNQLGVAFDAQIAERNEEFLAKVSRSYLRKVDFDLLLVLIDHAQARAKQLNESFNKLRQYYAEQDGLLTVINSGSYTSPKEKQLDESLEAARTVRDKLGAVAEQWRTSINLVKTSARGAINAHQYWNLVGHSKNSLERIHLALDCRHSIEESTLSLEYAHKSLSHVEFAHVSARQISAIQHANVYLLTDMSNAARFQHSRNVLESYQHNVAKSVNWLHETFRKTIKANLNEAERTVHLIAMQLRKERLNYIDGTTMGPKTYVPGGVEVVK